MVSSTWINRACVVVSCVLIAGCGAAGQSASEQQSSDDKPNSASASAADVKTPAPAADVATDRKDDRVSFVRRDQGIAKYPGTKLNEAMFEFKLYSDGSRELDGKYTEFWSDGLSKFVDGEYKDNVRTGTRRYYHSNGQLAREVKLVDGKPDGAWTRFREDGSKEMEVAYKAGKRGGTWKVYTKPETGEGDANDAKDTREPAKSADPKVEANPGKKGPSEATLLTEGTYKNGRRDGAWITYYPNGQKAAESNFKDDRKDGREAAWYRSGKKQLEADYKNGVPHGAITMWNEQGVVVLTREYKDGKLVPKSAKSTDQAAK